MISIERLNLILDAASGCRGCLVDDGFGIRTGDDMEPMTVGELHDICSLAMETLAAATPPEDGGITQALVAMARENAIEECADLADQNLDHYSGTECTYRGDVAEKIRALKQAEPQGEKHG